MTRSDLTLRRFACDEITGMAWRGNLQSDFTLYLVWYGKATSAFDHVPYSAIEQLKDAADPLAVYGRLIQSGELPHARHLDRHEIPAPIFKLYRRRKLRSSQAA